MVMSKVHVDIRDISNVKIVVKSIYYHLFVNGKTPLGVNCIVVFQHDWLGPGHKQNKGRDHIILQL